MPGSWPVALKLTGSTGMTGTSFHSETSIPSALANIGDSHLDLRTGSVYKYEYDPRSVSTLAGTGIYSSIDGPGLEATISTSYGITSDNSGNIFFTDLSKIRKIDASGVVTTIAGSDTTAFADGIGSSALFYSPNGIVADTSGNLFVMDLNNLRIRKVSPQPGFTWNSPQSLAYDTSGNIVTYLDASGILINGGALVTTIAGNATPTFTDGIGSSASFNYAYYLAIDKTGNIFVSDTNNHRIRKVSPQPGFTWNTPESLAYDSSGNPNTYIDASGNTVNGGGLVTTIAGASAAFADGIGSSASFNTPYGISIDTSGNIFVNDYLNFRIRKITPQPGFTWDSPESLAYDSSGNPNTYIDTSGNTLNYGGVVTTIAGSGSPVFANGIGSSASFTYPNSGLKVDTSGNVFLADVLSNNIRKIAPQPGFTWDSPESLVFDSSGIPVTYIDASGNTVKGGAIVTTIAGIPNLSGWQDRGARSALFNSPYDITIDTTGNIIVTDTTNSRIRKIEFKSDAAWYEIGYIGYTGATGDTGATGATGDTGPVFEFDGPTGSVLYYDGAEIKGDTGFSYTPGGTGINVDGHIIPATTLLQSIGSPDYRWKDVYIGPGSLNIEGWAIYPTGTPSNSDYDLVAREKASTGGLPAALFGPEYSLLNKNRLPNVIFIPPDTTTTSYTIPLTATLPASTRYVVRKDSYLNSLTFTTPVSPDPLLQTNYYVYLKNLGSSNVTVYHAPGGLNSTIINLNSPNIPTSLVYKPNNNQNATFQYIYWDGSNLVMV